MRRNMYTKVKSNPLVGYKRPANITVRDVDRTSVPLISPHAERRFTEILVKAPFNLYVVVVSSEEVDAEPAAAARLLQKLTREGIATRTFYVIRKVYKERAITPLPKWSEYRVSPMTPFMVLHRLFEEYLGEKYETSSEWSDWDSTLYEELEGPSGYADQREPRIAGLCSKDFTSAGVDTAAGRNIAIGLHGNAIADLWAKWCITGRVAFDPYAYPARWNEFPRSREDEARVRAWIARRVAVAPSIEPAFKKAAADLARGGAVMI